jgi:hypothetical protein
MLGEGLADALRHPAMDLAIWPSSVSLLMTAPTSSTTS